MTYHPLPLFHLKSCNSFPLHYSILDFVDLFNNTSTLLPSFQAQQFKQVSQSYFIHSAFFILRSCLNPLQTLPSKPLLSHNSSHLSYIAFSHLPFQQNVNYFCYNINTATRFFLPPQKTPPSSHFYLSLARSGDVLPLFLLPPSYPPHLLEGLLTYTLTPTTTQRRIYIAAYLQDDSLSLTCLSPHQPLLTLL